MDQGSPVRIGVDVGGTNTDAVAVRYIAQSQELPDRAVLAYCKLATTTDITQGITESVKRTINQAELQPNDIASVTIGTTHFINAVIERDVRRLRPVAVLRVSKSYLREIPPFAEWPFDLARLLHGYVGHLSGGLHIDGSQEASIDGEQIRTEARKIKALGLRAIVVAGAFSPIDDEFKQEDRIRDIILDVIPDADVICSHTIANIGFIERENASILNAAIVKYARRTITSFRLAMQKLNLTCPLFITQNDGSVLNAAQAAQTPIRTFLSGPTNSMRGAAFLSGLSAGDNQNVVIDIGGTTSDLGVLLPSGLPMQASAYVKVADISVNYAMPHLQSIGLGGGSIVEMRDDVLKIGPQSVGKDLAKKALVFDGSTITATDIMVASGAVSIGDVAKVQQLSSSLVNASLEKVKDMLEVAVDTVKLSADPLPVIIVGGGAILAPKSLRGASKLIRPPYYDVANAVGAAISRVCGTVDIIQSTDNQAPSAATAFAKDLAIQRAVRAGADPNTVEIVEVEIMPVSYLETRQRTIIKAIGDLDHQSNPSRQEELLAEGSRSEHDNEEELDYSFLPHLNAVRPPGDPLTYAPKVIRSATGILEWIISETDLEYLADGCYVLGCAGGGSPNAVKIQLVNSVRQGHRIRIMDASSLQPSDLIYGGGGLGSPAVSVERLGGTQVIGAIKVLMEYMGHDRFDAIMPLEIGGSNGLVPLIIGSSRFFDVAVIDADWMGRAYPTAWQTTLCAHEAGQLVPCAIDAGDGNTIIMKSSSNDRMVDSILRAACVEMGSAVGAATKPVTAKHVQQYSVLNTCSLAWRIGRAIARCQKMNQITTVAEAIIQEAGGNCAAKVLFRGKIVEVENKLFKGHTYGIVHIQDFDLSGDGGLSPSEQVSRPVAVGGTLHIPYKNENIYAEHTEDSGKTKIIASVPDLIAIIDSGSGRALGVPEFKYGHRVVVIGITCSPRWVDTPQALEIGGPRAFGFDHDYCPLGVYVEPTSVITEYAPT